MTHSKRVRRAARWMAVSGVVWALMWLLDIASLLLAGVFWPRWIGPIPFLQAAWLRAVPWLCWWLMSPAVFALADRYRFAEGQRGRSAVAHVVAAIVTMLAKDIVMVVVLTQQGLQTPRFIVSVPGLVLYAVVAGTAIVLALQRRERELEAQVAVARQQALTAQLKPHFLYNALNGVAMLIRAGEREPALNAVFGYAELLRSTLHSDAAEVPLSQELVSIDRYLSIEKMRFPDSLTTLLVSTPEAARALVPNLILQPLVENALHHGLAEKEQDARLDVVASCQDGAVRVEVRDNGAGLPPGWQIDRAIGVGLGNTRSRLRQRYGDRARIEVYARPGGGTIAAIELPFQAQPVEHHA